MNELPIANDDGFLARASRIDPEKIGTFLLRALSRERWQKREAVDGHGNFCVHDLGERRQDVIDSRAPFALTGGADVAGPADDKRNVEPALKVVPFHTSLSQRAIESIFSTRIAIPKTVEHSRRIVMGIGTRFMPIVTCEDDHRVLSDTKRI